MKKSILGICLTGVMAVIIGVAGIVGIMSMRAHNEYLYIENILGMSSIARVLESTQQLRALPYKAFYAASPNDEFDLSRLDQEFTVSMGYFEQSIYEFEAYIVTPEVRGAFDELMSVYHNEYKPLLAEMQNYIRSAESREELPYFIELMREPANAMANCAERCFDLVSEMAKNGIDSAEYSARYMVVVMVVLIVLEIALAVVFIFFIMRGTGSRNPAYKKSYARGAPPVYAMYPVDPSNPSNPPHATHILYPVMTPSNPPHTDSQQYSG